MYKFESPVTSVLENMAVICYSEPFFLKVFENNNPHTKFGVFMAVGLEVI